VQERVATGISISHVPIEMARLSLIRARKFTVRIAIKSNLVKLDKVQKEAANPLTTINKALKVPETMRIQLMISTVISFLQSF
jgi:hypothetical protein